MKLAGAFVEIIDLTLLYYYMHASVCRKKVIII